MRNIQKKAKNYPHDCVHQFAGGETEKAKVAIDMMSGTAMDFFWALDRAAILGSAKVSFYSIQLELRPFPTSMILCFDHDSDRSVKS